MAASPPHRPTGSTGHLISGSPRWPRRPPAPGTRRLTRTTLPAEGGKITREIARARHQAAGAERGGGKRLADTRLLEPRHGKSVFGLDREAVRRPAQRLAVVAGAATTCCATNRATSCSTRLGLGEDEIPMVLKARLHRYGVLSCGPISPSRWACRSAIRNARAAAAAIRRNAAPWFSIQYAERRASGPPTANRMPRRPRSAGEAIRASRHLRPLSAGRRRRRSFRRRAHAGERRQHRFLYRAADAGDAAPGHHLRRSLRPRTDAGAARAADRRSGGRLPRRRRGARRVGHAQALLARQFPVRARSLARQPGLQALPADRAQREAAACGG